MIFINASVHSSVHDRVTPHLFAGAGVIISSGLMRMMSFQEVEEFLTNRSIFQSGGEQEHEHSMSTA